MRTDNDEIRGRAREHVRLMQEKNGGDLPKNMVGWLRLAARFGLAAVPISNSAVKGRLVKTARGIWFIAYNRDLAPSAQMLVIAHELSEYLGRAEDPMLFEDSFPICFDGADSPRGALHRIAVAATRIAAELLSFDFAEAFSRKHVPRLQPRFDYKYSRPRLEIERIADVWPVARVYGRRCGPASPPP